MLAKLVIVGGKANREEIKLKLPTTVGRSRKSGIVIDHHTVSRQHCELYEEHGKVHVRDLGSLNGTFVGGEQVQGACLEHGTELAVGPLTFQVVYNHLADPARPVVDDAVRPDESDVAPEMAQTVVDLPRVALPAVVDELSNAAAAAPLVDLSSGEDDHLNLPADESVVSPPAMEESAPVIDLSSDDDFELSVEEPALELPAEAEPLAGELASESPGVEKDDVLGFDLAADAATEIAPTAAEPAPRASAAPAPPDEEDFLSMMAEETAVNAPPAVQAEDATVESAATNDDDFLAMMAEEAGVSELPVEEERPASAAAAPTPIAPATASGDDDFLDMITEETAAAEKPAASPVEEPELSFEDAEPEPAIELAPAKESTATVDDELDWLAADEPTSGEPADVDLDELAANMPPNPALGSETVIEEVAELRFDEPDAAAPAETPAQAEAPAPVAKKKRGLWSFGRKQKAPTEAAEVSPAESPAASSAEAGIAAEPPAPEVIGAETVIMDTVDFDADDDVAAEESAVDIRRTQHVSHEKTVILDPAIEVAVEEGSSPPETKPKRGRFGLGRKSKSAGPEVSAEAAAVSPMEATPEPSATEAPVKKRGWWPFAKKSNAVPAEPDTAPALDTPSPAPVKPSAGTTSGPTPESFEFSDEELLEITAENTPPAPAKPRNPQELAADEVLDFELDIPLHDSSGNISPVLSDAPPPATGADDDDFLDFLAEELPGAKRKGSS